MFKQQQWFTVKFLNEHFLEAIQKFQQLVLYGAQQTIKTKSLQAFTGSVQDLNTCNVQDLSRGYNKLASVQLSIIRALKNQNFIFLFVTEKKFKQSKQSKQPSQNNKMYLQNVPIFYCLIIQSLFDNVASQKKFVELSHYIGQIIDIRIHEPYKQMEPVNDLVVLRAPPENIVIGQQKEKWHNDPNLIKKTGNEAFNRGKFLSSYILYQYALSCCYEIDHGLKRSILYSNCSACFYKMNLYDACIRYSTIAIKINSSYQKSYVRKINGLLQKKLFSQIPVLLMSLQKKQNTNYVEQMNKKYSIFLSNSLGMYNWLDIIANKDDINVAYYHSKKIGLKIEGDKYAYYALQDIKSFEFLLLAKPMVYIKKPDNQRQMQDLYFQVAKCSTLQRSFGSILKALPCQKYPQGGYPPNSKSLSTEQVARKLKRCLIYPKHLIQPNSIQKQYKGVWGDLFKFIHKCKPNCSWVNIRNLLCVSSIQQIKKGQTLTLDLGYNNQKIAKRRYLQKSYGIYCNCQICEPLKKPQPPITKQIYAEIRKNSQINVRKNKLWNIIDYQLNQNQKLSNQLIKQYIQTVNLSLNWDDILNMINITKRSIQINRANRSEQIDQMNRKKQKITNQQNNQKQFQKSQRNLFIESMLMKSLSTFLKVHKKQALCILNSIV